MKSGGFHGHEIRRISWQGLRYIYVLVLNLVAMKSAEFHSQMS